jgi:hypothetical protein
MKIVVSRMTEHGYRDKEFLLRHFDGIKYHLISKSTFTFDKSIEKIEIVIKGSESDNQYSNEESN